MALGSTQPLTEMDTRNTSRGIKADLLRADNLATFVCFHEIWEPQAPRILWPVQVCNGIAFFFYLFYNFISIRIVAVGQIPYRYCQYWVSRCKLCEMKWAWHNCRYCSGNCLDTWRQIGIDAFTLSGIRTEASVPDSRTVNSLTSQLSSQIRTATLSQFWHRTVAGYTQTCQSVMLLLL